MQVRDIKLKANNRKWLKSKQLKSNLKVTRYYYYPIPRLYIYRKFALRHLKNIWINAAALPLVPHLHLPLIMIGDKSECHQLLLLAPRQLNLPAFNRSHWFWLQILLMERRRSGARGRREEYLERTQLVSGQDNSFSPYLSSSSLLSPLFTLLCVSSLLFFLLLLSLPLRISCIICE